MSFFPIILYGQNETKFYLDTGIGFMYPLSVVGFPSFIMEHKTHHFLRY